MDYIKFIKKPDITMYPGIRVNKNTDITFKNDKVEQTIRNHIMHTEMIIKGDGFESVQNTMIDLKDGDILIFEEEDRGWVKPVESLMTVAEAIEELECIKDM